jgi:hypothetical protein
MQNNPQVVFERLFGDGSSMETKARANQSLSLLDSVLGEATPQAKLRRRTVRDSIHI